MQENGEFLSIRKPRSHQNAAAGAATEGTYSSFTAIPKYHKCIHNKAEQNTIFDAFHKQITTKQVSIP